MNSDQVHPSRGTDSMVRNSDLERSAIDDLPRLVHEAMGAASMCWEHPERAGVFQSSKASEIAWQLIHAIRATQPTKEQK